MAKKHKFDYDLIVIGSGAGGSAAAAIAARAGKKVAVVESDVFGGDSPNFSDVPMDALMHVARTYDQARHAAKLGIRSTTLGYNYPSIRTWKEYVVARTGAGGNRRYYDNLGVDTLSGRAHFLSPNEISVNRRHLSAKNFIIATGSTWQTPNIHGLRDVPYFTPRTILETIRPPKTLLVIGGGAVGLEIANLLAIFGTKVYIAEKQPRLLPSFEPEASELITRVLSEQKGITAFTSSEVISVVKEGLGKKVIVKRGNEEKSFRVDEVLVACGRTPSLDLGLDNASVAYSPAGIIVDDHLQTTSKHIFAAGDVLGREYNQTHSAILESRVAVHNIMHADKMTPDYKATPRTTSLQPNIATVGMTEAEYTANKIAVKTAIAPLNIVAKSNTTDFHDGFVKLITDKKGVLLGGTIVSPVANEMIHELALAVKHDLTASDLAQTPHAFLSWSEALKVAAVKLS